MYRSCFFWLFFASRTATIFNTTEPQPQIMLLSSTTSVNWSSVGTSIPEHSMDNLSESGMGMSFPEPSLSGTNVGTLFPEYSLGDSSVETSFPRHSLDNLNGNSVGTSFPGHSMNNLTGTSFPGHRMDNELMRLEYEAPIYYAKLFLFTTGTLRNVLTICIWLTDYFLKMPRSPVSITLAVVDTLYLILAFWGSTMWHFSQEKLLASSDLSCKIIFTAMGAMQHLDSWMIVFLSVERFLAVTSPFLVKSIMSKLKALIYVTLATLIFLAFNVYISVHDVSLWRLANGNTQCKIVPSTAIIIRQFLIGLIPLVIIIPCNLVIVIKVISQYRKMRHSIPLTQHQMAKKKSIRVSIMTLSITISFIILIVPQTVLRLWCRNHHNPYCDPLRLRIYFSYVSVIESQNP